MKILISILGLFLAANTSHAAYTVEGSQAIELFRLISQAGVSSGKIKLLVFQTETSGVYQFQSATLTTPEHGIIDLSPDKVQIQQVIELFQTSGVKKEVFDGGYSFIEYTADVECPYVNKCSLQ